MEKVIELNLPEWCFLDGHTQEGDGLEGRTVINHIRSASIIEAFHGDFILNENVLFKKYVYNNIIGDEEFTLAIHYCMTLDIIRDREMIIQQILNPCSEWYKKYLEWEDNNIFKGECSKLN